MNNIALWLTSPIWLFLAITDYMDIDNLVKRIKTRYKEAKKFSFDEFHEEVEK